MLVKGVMKREVSVVGPDAWLALAACMMRDQDVGCLPVVEDGRLIGMITDRDITVRGVAGGLDPHRAMVREVMSANAIACTVDDTVEQARELMAANLIKHLPVLDHRQRLVGLVALRDISGQFAKCKPHEVTFYKRLQNSSGHVHNVEVAKLYLSPAVRKDDAIPAALARFEQHRGLACWEEAADLYEVKGDG
ncbi:MAG: putative signal transduction protein with domain [Geminicoccaceae bacterium]|nr:putative signal transduction protein with domain [Geminicoccaceae bacterium]